jgi:small-conductance mechanosensitive channel
MIVVAFEECGIVIAYPQQDVHLDAAKPIPVQMVPMPERPPISAPGAKPVIKPDDTQPA